MDGFIIVNKPRGITSFDVIRHLRRISGIKKIGHGGTLDPMATGVLVVALGKGTKRLSSIENADKVYKAKMTLGITTDTQDITGKVVAENSAENITADMISKVIEGFAGEIYQIPPMVSAVKHKGKPLYKYARRGVEIKRDPRPVNIYDIKILDCAVPEVSFVVKCSKGTYIRTLCHDIGDKLGCGAVLSGLERSSVGEYSIEDSCSLDEIKNVEDFILPIDAVGAGSV